MTDLQAYQATLAQLQADRDKTVARIEKLDAAISAIRELIADAQKANTANAPRVPTSNRLAHATMKDAAAFVLREAGRPLRIREIFDAMIANGYKYRRDFRQFRGSMAPTLTREDKIFRKAGPGLYGLASSNGTHAGTVSTQTALVDMA